MARGRWYRPAPPLLTRRLDASIAVGPFKSGQVIVARQTREFQLDDWVLVSRDGQESLAQIRRHQGDLIYLVRIGHDPKASWLHAKYIVGKVIWPVVN